MSVDTPALIQDRIDNVKRVLAAVLFFWDVTNEQNRCHLINCHLHVGFFLLIAVARADFDRADIYISLLTLCTPQHQDLEVVSWMVREVRRAKKHGALSNVHHITFAVLTDLVLAEFTFCCAAVSI
jgi:hypothetical protein